MVSAAVLRTLGLGQCISLLIAGTGIFATFLSKSGANYPTILSCLNYCMLSLYLIKVYCRDKRCSSSSAAVAAACCPGEGEDRDNDRRMDVGSSYDKFGDDDGGHAGAASHNNSRRSSGGHLDTDEEDDGDVSPPPVPISIYWYLLAAFLDVQANFLVLLAYNYTSITSIMLLDCFTVPSAMVFSSYFLSYKYSKKHIIGAFVCVLGLVFIILGDSVIHNDRTNSIGGSSNSVIFGNHNLKKYIDDYFFSSSITNSISDGIQAYSSNNDSDSSSSSIDSDSSSNFMISSNISSSSSDSSNSDSSSNNNSRALLGDIICISGAILYAAANVLQEFIVKTTGDQETFLGRMGAIAAVIAFIQFWILDFSNFDYNGFLSQDVMLYVCGFVLCLFLMYSLTSHFLLKSDATLFNLSLLSSDIYAVLFAFLVFNQQLSFMYVIAFVLVVTGLIIYHRENSPRRSGLAGLADASRGDRAIESIPSSLPSSRTSSSPSSPPLATITAIKSSGISSVSSANFRDSLSSKKFIDEGSNHYTIISPMADQDSSLDV